MKASLSMMAMILVAALAGAAPVRAERWTAIERLPDAAPVEVLVRDKPRIYFRLVAERPLEVSIEGPVRLRLTTRVLLPSGAKTVATYQVRASEGDRALDQLSTESSAASEARLQGSSQVVGKSRKLTLDLPAGRHLVRLDLAGASAVLVRMQQSSDVAAKVPTVSLTPISASRSVSVSEGEKIIPYYTARVGDPVRLRVVGPAQLELLTRLDFDPTMRGTVAYQLRIVEKDRALRSLDLRTTKAMTAAYTNLPDRVPSKVDRVSLTIPEGLHEIAVELVRPVRGAAEIHARIPQPTTGSEE